MEKKIFFSDMDGTLLTTGKRISEKTKKALDDFVAAGNVFAISTGRGIDNVISVRSELGLEYPGMYLICYNGALIYECDTKKTVFRTGVPLKFVPEIFALAADRGIHCQTYTDHSIVTPDNGEEMQYYNKIIKRPLVVTDDIAGSLSEDPCKILAVEMHDRDKVERFRLEIMEKYGDTLTTVYSKSDPWYMEIITKDAGKGSAVKWLSEYLGIPVENTIAAGDEENDISMIEAAGLGIAMCNASDTVKRSADTVTSDDNDHDGLAPYLERSVSN